MDEDRIKNLIKVWYNKAHSERAFSGFVFLWFCFNAWLDHKTQRDRDSEMIEDLANKSPKIRDMLDAYDVAFSSGTEVVKNNIKTLALMSPIKDVRGKRNPVAIQDENDFPNIVWAIYRIRCNLFHGGAKNSG